MISLVAFTDRKAIAGKAAGATIRLRKRIGYSNSFQPILTATLSADGAGTLLHGRIGLHPAVVASSTSPQGDVWVGLAVPPAMLLFGYALIRFGRHLAADEGALLADFLAKTVEARFQSEST